MCHFCENGEFHIMSHRSKFLVQTCYSITHSIAFRSHLTSKWSRGTPDESDLAPSLNSFQFGIHIVYLTNGTGSFWLAHCFGVMDSGDKCSPALFCNTVKECKVHWSASLSWSLMEYYWIMFFFSLQHQRAQLVTRWSFSSVQHMLNLKTKCDCWMSREGCSGVTQFRIWILQFNKRL